MSEMQGVDLSQNRMKSRVKTNNKDSGVGGLAVVRRLTGGGRQREAMERVANEMALSTVNPAGAMIFNFTFSRSNFRLKTKIEFTLNKAKLQKNLSFAAIPFFNRGLCRTLKQLELGYFCKFRLCRILIWG